MTSADMWCKPMVMFVGSWQRSQYIQKVFVFYFMIRKVNTNRVNFLKEETKVDLLETYTISLFSSVLRQEKNLNYHMKWILRLPYDKDDYKSYTFQTMFSLFRQCWSRFLWKLRLSFHLGECRTSVENQWWRWVSHKNPRSPALNALRPKGISSWITYVCTDIKGFCDLDTYVWYVNNSQWSTRTSHGDPRFPAL